MQSGDFKALPPSARIAVLSQAKNYPDARSIGNLQLLAGTAVPTWRVLVR